MPSIYRHKASVILKQLNLGIISMTRTAKKIKTISTSQGELKGYSSTFYIIKQGSGFYITYDVNGKRLHTFGANSVGEIVGAAGDTFTSRNGSWLYTWSKDGKKINTRSAK